MNFNTFKRHYYSYYYCYYYCTAVLHGERSNMKMQNFFHRFSATQHSARFLLLGHFSRASRTKTTVNISYRRIRDYLPVHTGERTRERAFER